MKDETITANGTAIYDFKDRSKINIPGKYVQNMRQLPANNYSMEWVG